MRKIVGRCSGAMVLCSLLAAGIQAAPVFCEGCYYRETAVLQMRAENDQWDAMVASLTRYIERLENVVIPGIQAELDAMEATPPSQRNDAWEALYASKLLALSDAVLAKLDAIKQRTDYRLRIAWNDMKIEAAERALSECTVCN